MVRLASRARVAPAGRLLAGLVFAATPLAFTPLYWASGVQELLAAVCALGAVLCWTQGTRRGYLVGAVLTLGAIAAKESGLGLPLFLAALLALGDDDHPDDRPLAWALILFLGLAAVLEGALVLGHFRGGDGPYALGGPVTMLGNLGVFGFWMVSPGPIFASHLTWPMVGGGGALFMLWASWAIMSWRRGRRLPAATLLACLLILAPALPLTQQLKPYLAYLAAAPAALALASLVPRDLHLRPAVLAAAAVLVIVGSFTGMRARIGNRNALGLPADPVVRATALSWQTTRLLEGLTWQPDDALPHQVVLLQLPVKDDALERAENLGERFVSETEMQQALGGSLGPNLVGAGRLHVVWANALQAVPARALVLCEAGDGFKVWGPTPNALLYLALTDVGLGHFEQARRSMVRAGALEGKEVSFLYDPGQMAVPPELVLRRKEAFIDWTVARLDHGSSGFEVGGLQDMFLNLLSKATGLSRAALTEGSRTLGQGAAADTTGAAR